MKGIWLGIALTTLTCAPLWAQRPEAMSPPEIIVTGEADLRVVPDEATVRIGIVRQANNAQVAQQQVNAAAQEILASVMKAGIAESAIQTSRLTLNPIYAQRDDARKIVAYNAQNVVSIRVDDLTLVGPVIDAGLKAGANELQGVQFSLHNDLPSRQQVLKDAVTAARKKAEAMAEALNVTLVRILQVQEQGVSVSPRFELPLAARASADFAAPTPVSPGDIDVHAGVTIRFEIAERPKR